MKILFINIHPTKLHSNSGEENFTDFFCNYFYFSLFKLLTHTQNQPINYNDLINYIPTFLQLKTKMKKLAYCHFQFLFNLSFILNTHTYVCVCVSVCTVRIQCVYIYIYIYVQYICNLRFCCHTSMHFFSNMRRSTVT